MENNYKNKDTTQINSLIYL